MLSPHSPSPWRARLELRFARMPGLERSALVHNRHEGPLLVQKALYPEGHGVCHAVVLHPPGGIAGGDELSLEVQVEEGAHALVATPSATRWYRADGRLSRQTVTLRVAQHACLEWIPEENLFYEASYAEQHLEVHAEAGARLIAWDGYMLGRIASGDPWQRGQVRLASRLHHDAELVFYENAAMHADDALIGAAPGTDRLRCGATLFALAPSLTPEAIEAFAAGLPYGAQLRAGAGLIAPGVMVLRALAAEAEPLRQLLRQSWASLRPLVCARAAAPLRLWAC